MDKQELFERLKKDKIEVVTLQFADLSGNLKGTNIFPRALKEAIAKGTWFDGSSIEGFARIMESDRVLQLELGTYRVLPWEPTTARILCDIYRPDGEPLESDTRQILKRTLARLKEKGIVYNTGAEVEFMLFKISRRGELLPVDKVGYFDVSHGPGRKFLLQMMHVLEKLGMEVEMGHHEVAPSQFEIDIRFADALTTADNILTLKQAVASIAAEYKLEATFMPKPVAGENGSGMHTHQSIFRDGKNAVYDGSDRYHLSKYAHNFIAGQLKHARALSAVVAPTVNSYKRLVPGFEAPVYLCHATSNRSAAIRIPHYSKGREQSTRAELRFPDPSCNPYLAFNAMWAAGLDGMLNEIEPPSPVEEDVYHFSDEELKKREIKTLPGTLIEALNELENDPVIHNSLQGAYDPFMRMKRQEWGEYRTQDISHWEIERYF